MTTPPHIFRNHINLCVKHRKVCIRTPKHFWPNKVRLSVTAANLVHSCKYTYRLSHFLHIRLCWWLGVLLKSNTEVTRLCVTVARSRNSINRCSWHTSFSWAKVLLVATKTWAVDWTHPEQRLKKLPLLGVQAHLGSENDSSEKLSVPYVLVQGAPNGTFQGPIPV